jgi:lysophospholipase L1-like esterase
MSDIIEPLRFFNVQKVLPAVYGDELSYYELLAKMEQKINEEVGSINDQNVKLALMQKAVDDFIAGGYKDGFEEFLDTWFAENMETINQYLEDGFSGELDEIRESITTSQEQTLDTVADEYVPFPVATASKYGTDGQVLRTNGDGTTQWQAPLIPTDQQAETYISAWLDAHPEATTTVQDGSLTTSKYANNSITDEKLVQSGGVLEKVDDLDSALFNYEEESIVVNGTSTSLQNSTYGLGFTEDIVIETITPNFVDSSASFSWELRRVESITTGQAGTVIMSGNGVAGDAININRVVQGGKTILIIRSASQLYYKSGNTQIPSIIMVQFNSTISNIFQTFIIAGEYNLFNKEIKFITSDYADSKYLSITEATNTYAKITDVFTIIQESIIINHTSSSAQNNTYGIGFTEDIAIETIVPNFVDSSASFSWELREVDSITVGQVGTVIMSGNGVAGDAININRVVQGGKTILIIRSASQLYYNSRNTQISGIIMVEFNTRIATVFSSYILSGVYNILAKIEKYKLADNAHNYLYNKTIMACGDSMVAGHSLGINGSWVKKIADRNEMTMYNLGTNGATLSNHQYAGTDNSVYSKICDPNSPLYINDNQMATFDYILIFAGTNDASRNITLGQPTSTNSEEFYGALNLICEALHTRAPLAKVGFITPYKRNSTYVNYINAICEICNEYSIPVFDNSKNGGIEWGNAAQMQALTLGDNLHLNATGLEFASYKYESFMRTL